MSFVKSKKISDLTALSQLSVDDSVIVHKQSNGVDYKGNLGDLARMFRPTFRIVAFKDWNLRDVPPAGAFMDIDADNADNYNTDILNLVDDAHSFILPVGKFYYLTHPVETRPERIDLHLLTRDVGSLVYDSMQDWESSSLSRSVGVVSPMLYQILDLTNATVNKEVSLFFNNDSSSTIITDYFDTFVHIMEYLK